MKMHTTKIEKQEKEAKEKVAAKLLENKIIDRAEEAGKLLGWS